MDKRIRRTLSEKLLRKGSPTSFIVPQASCLSFSLLPQPLHEWWAHANQQLEDNQYPLAEFHPGDGGGGFEGDELGADFADCVDGDQDDQGFEQGEFASRLRNSPGWSLGLSILCFAHSCILPRVSFHSSTMHQKSA